MARGRSYGAATTIGGYSCRGSERARRARAKGDGLQQNGEKRAQAGQTASWCHALRCPEVSGCERGAFDCALLSRRPIRPVAGTRASPMRWLVGFRTLETRER